jgi:AcrR family transcriptional regulator
MISVRRPTENDWSGPSQRVGDIVAEQDTRLRILAAAKGVLLDVGYANLSTRGIAEAAGVPLSQIHYHFGTKQNLRWRPEFGVNQRAWFRFLGEIMRSL